MISVRCTLLLLLCACLCALSTADDRITNLPGLLTQPTWAQYAGYITVDEAAGRDVFYWFCESQRNGTDDPVVIWLQGGPGCSGLIGLMSENGPYRPHPYDPSTLELNPYSWNRIANVLYIESPAGVGFSYSNTSSDYNVGDQRTANDSYTLLLKFFQMYPQFANRQFWVTGESYGGHYVPELTERILQGNAQGNQKINLKGMMAGNPWTYMPVDNNGAIMTWQTHFLNPSSTIDSIKAKCDLSDYGPLKKREAEGEVWSYNATACDDAVQLSTTQMGNIDIYDMYVDVCLANMESRMLEALARAGSPIHKAMLPKKKRSVYRSTGAHGATGGDPNPTLDPCIDDHLTSYLNLPAVQAAIHARPMQWQECSSIVNYNYTDVRKSVLPVYEEIFAAGLEVLVYSGDVDAIVPTYGTWDWVSGLGQPITEAWRPWPDQYGQVGGYVTKFEKLTFTTVRNAGHMVPWFQPYRAWTMFSNFIQHQKMPTTTEQCTVVSQPQQE